MIYGASGSLSADDCRPSSRPELLVLIVLTVGLPRIAAKHIIDKSAANKTADVAIK